MSAMQGSGAAARLLGARCVVAVHAHPDDESSKGAATMAMLADRGVRTVLVTCTDGQAGDVLNAEMEAPSDLVALRRDELSEAVRILRFAESYTLGFEDSGLDAAKEGCFANVPLEDVAARLDEIFRAERPDVVVTYDRAYAQGHPDHLRCLDATTAAAGDIPLFLTRTYSPARLRAMHDWLVARGDESPYERMVERVKDDATPFEHVEVGGYIEVARRALAAHRSQVSPSDQWWFSVPTEVLREIYPWEDFTT